MEGAGDSTYVLQARRIQENIRQLAEISTELQLPQEARSLAVETHGMLKRFNAVTTSVDVYGTEKSQRRMTHKKLKTQYQTALKAIDSAAQASLGILPTPPSEPVAPSYDSDSKCSSEASSRVSRHLPQSLRHPQADPGEVAARATFTTPGSRHHSYLSETSWGDCAGPRGGRTSPHEIYRAGYPQLSSNGMPAAPGHVELVEGYTSASTSVGVSSTGSLSRQELECFSPNSLQQYQQSQFHPPQRQQATYNNVLQIEKDVRGIHELYKEMAWQVSNSVDDLDAIESQMRSAVVFSHQGVEELSAAHRTLRFRRRLMFMLTAGLCVVALIAFVVFRLFF